MNSPLTLTDLSAEERQWVKAQLRLAGVRIFTGDETVDELREIWREDLEKAKDIAARAAEDPAGLSLKERARFDALAAEMDAIGNRIGHLAERERARERVERCVRQTLSARVTAAG